MPIVWIPPSLRGLTQGQAQVQVQASSVSETIIALDLLYPGIRDRLCKDGELDPALHVAVDSTISHQGLDQLVGQDSEVHFIPAISGG